tara:strand:+ start:1253 stop:1414 length:162 start_codon:yes stop_codon:yes gene_type:complete
MNKKQLIEMLKEIITVDVEFNRCSSEVTVCVTIRADGEEIHTNCDSEYFDFDD